MLQEVLEHINNYFLKGPNPGTYVIANGSITPVPALKEGQRFWIVGSDLNDGVYTYHAAGLTDSDDAEAAGLQDETFAGTIGALAVPPAVIALSGEIKEWVDNFSDAVNSPYQSESFNGYSYTLKSGGRNSQGDDSPIGWQSVFKSRLDRWRRPFV